MVKIVQASFVGDMEKTEELNEAIQKAKAAGLEVVIKKEMTRSKLKGRDTQIEISWKPSAILDDAYDKFRDGIMDVAVDKLLYTTIKPDKKVKKGKKGKRSKKGKRND